MSICLCMKDVFIIVSFPLLPPDAGELLEEKVAILTIGWAMASCIGYEPTSLRLVQGATDVITCGPSLL